MKPTDYFIRYEDPELVARELERVGGDYSAGDPARTYVTRDYPTLAAAKRAARRLSAGAVYRRVNLIDVTPDYLPVETMWEWEEELAWEPDV